MFGLDLKTLGIAVLAFLALMYSLLSFLIPIFIFQIRDNTRETKRLMEEILALLKKKPNDTNGNGRHYRIDP